MSFVDYDLYCTRRKRARLDDASFFLVELLCSELEARLELVSRRFEKILVLSDSVMPLINRLRRMYPDAIIDCASFFDRLNSSGLPEHISENYYDLIVSGCELHLIDDVSRYLRLIRKALRPDGLLIGAVPEGKTLSNVRQAMLGRDADVFGGASRRFWPLIDIKDMGQLLQINDFRLPVVDVEDFQVSYMSLFSLARDMRALGATYFGVQRSHHSYFRRDLRELERRLKTDVRFMATFSFVWFLGWHAHDSQQKPLAPGTAQVSLKEILK